MKMIIKGTFSAALISLSVSGIAEAALHNRGGGLIYDDVLDVTWLQDANYAVTSGYAVDNAVDNGNRAANNIFSDGRMGWDAANNWVANLEYYDSVRGVTYDDWRLPTMSPINGTIFNTSYSNNATTDSGYAPTTTDGSDGGWRNVAGNPVSEMGHMYYVNLANQSGSGLNNKGDFTNLQPYYYWSGTKLSSSFGWFFITADGRQEFSYSSRYNEFYAWAVRPGDVSAVPIPAAVWLFGSGLIGLIGWSKRKQR